MYFPAWYLGNFPDRRIILASYEAEFARSWGRKSRDVLEAVGPELFGVRVSKSSSAAAAWDIEGHRGGMNTAGVGGPITGKGAHVLIIDDPIKNDAQARSATERENQKNWYRSTARTRMNADPKGAIIIIMTRWHDDDLVGWLLKESKKKPKSQQWEVVDFPAIATMPTTEGMTDFERMWYEEVGKKKFEDEWKDALGRKVGEALWPAMYPLEELEEVKLDLGAYWFAAMYQQTPIPEGGHVFKSDWLIYGDAPSKFDYIIQAWDTAMEEKEINDYSVCCTFGLHEGTAYLLHVWRGRAESPKLLEMIKSQAARYHPRAIYIEKDGKAGTAAIQMLRRLSNLPVMPVDPIGDKVARANLVTPYLQTKRVVICSGPWNNEFETELLTFPVAAHDDQVDSFVYGLMKLFGRQPRRISVQNASGETIVN